MDGKVTACNTGAVVISSGAVTATLSATDNAVLDTIDAVLDTIKVDTEAIETAVESLDGKVTACNTGAVVISSGSVTATLSATDNAVLDTIDTVLDNIKADAMDETVIFNAVINATASGVSSAFARPRNATNWAILIENTSTNNGNHEIHLGRSVNNSIYFTSSTDYNTVGERNNVIEFNPTETLGSQKYYKITINNQDSSNHTYKVTVCA